MARLNQRVPFPADLPEVPEPVKKVIVRTGQHVPCYGIFEPLVPDGCMNYFLEGMSTPQAVNVDEGDGDFVVRPAVWRLIWEDTRYLDGIIPAEEQSYFPPEAAVEATQPAWADVDPLVQQSSNDVASRSGVWVVADRLDLRRQFNAGDRLPQYEGRDVMWIWSDKQ